MSTKKTTSIYSSKYIFDYWGSWTAVLKQCCKLFHFTHVRPFCSQFSAFFAATCIVHYFESVVSPDVDSSVYQTKYREKVILSGKAYQVLQNKRGIRSTVFTKKCLPFSVSLRRYGLQKFVRALCLLKTGSNVLKKEWQSKLRATKKIRACPQIEKLFSCCN